MEQRIESLQKLQTVDLIIRELTEGLRRYPDEINNLKKDLLEKEESINLKETTLSELKTQSDNLESSLRSNQESIKKSEERLFSIKTHREYEALQKEITDTRKENLEIEDRTISVMTEIEETETALVEEKENYATLKEQYAQQIAEKEKKIEELEISRKPAEKEKKRNPLHCRPENTSALRKNLQKKWHGPRACRKREMHKLQHQHPTSTLQRNTETGRTGPVPELQEDPLHHLLDVKTATARWQEQMRKRYQLI